MNYVAHILLFKLRELYYMGGVLITLFCRSWYTLKNIGLILLLDFVSMQVQIKRYDTAEESAFYYIGK